MEDDLKDLHQEKFGKWAESGYISNENSYNVKTTYIITKQFNKIPAYKYFKTVFTSEDGLAFFCMIKMNLKSNKL